MRFFIYTVIGIVAASIVAGFFIVGSPKEARLRKFDEERVNNLSLIQSEILNYWVQKGRLPENLDALIDNLRGVVVPKDPQTQEKYVYVIGEKKLTFSLCANFSTDLTYSNKLETQPKFPRPIYMSSDPYQGWEHGQGFICFERTIDPELYSTSKLEPKR